MILTVIRHGEQVLNMDKIICGNRDFLIALELSKTLLRHSQSVFDSMDSGFLSIQDEDILDSLPHIFTRKQIIDKGEELKIPNRTIDDKLRQWQSKKVIKKQSKGLYKKM